MATSASKSSNLTSDLPIRVCLDCDKLLTEASDAMRRHAGDMTVGMFLIHRGDLTRGNPPGFQNKTCSILPRRTVGMGCVPEAPERARNSTRGV